MPTIGGISEFQTNPVAILIDQTFFCNRWIPIFEAKHVSPISQLFPVHCPSCTLKICLGGKKRAFSRLVRRKMNLSVTWDTSESISWSGIQKVGCWWKIPTFLRQTLDIHSMPFVLCVFLYAYSQPTDCWLSNSWNFEHLLLQHSTSLIRQRAATRTMEQPG